jgi:NAD(P)H-hydrate epimerase
MALADVNAREFSGIGDISDFDNIGVGSGLGTSEISAKGLDELLTKSDRPVVLDADALNLLAKDNSLLKKLPENSILTPHLKEFERIFGAAGDHFERLRMAQRAAGKYKVIIVLKGAHTAVVKPDGNIYFNSTGNPGMATAGSGDSLTGILTSMLAQGYAAGEAAIISTFIHGLAGDYAAVEKGYAGMTSGDLIKYLPQAFKEFEEL